MGSAGNHFAVDVRRTGDGLAVAPRGELDIATVAQVRAALLARRPGEGLLFDLSGLNFLDTSGLALVVDTHRRARQEGFPLTIVRGGRRVQRVFEIAGLEGILPFEDRAPRAPD